MKTFAQSFIVATSLLLFCLLAQPSLAQVASLTPAQQEKELRRSLKEAKRLQTDFNESHLNMEAVAFKRGESGRKRVKGPQEQELMLINEAGTATNKPKLKARKNKSARKRR
ncbi:hypothetical protein [Rufibacter sp. LB8]|uniref:hypothetical protein n=1 Tax=Rufibacter sp. LB8 TaxID=2777781 RepID=UPI00178C552F|nr:hypothetical protein [Rufibacter sp. LB8]